MSHRPPQRRGSAALSRQRQRHSECDRPSSASTTCSPQHSAEAMVPHEHPPVFTPALHNRYATTSA